MAHILEHHSSAYWGQQPYMPNSDNLACNVINHLHVAVVANSRGLGGMMPTMSIHCRQGLAHFGNWWPTTPPCFPRLPRCLFFLGSSLVQHRHLPIIFLEMSTILLEVPWLPALQACRPSSWLWPCPQLLLVLGTSIPTSSPIHVTISN